MAYPSVGQDYLLAVSFVVVSVLPNLFLSVLPALARSIGGLGQDQTGWKLAVREVARSFICLALLLQERVGHSESFQSEYFCFSRIRSMLVYWNFH